MKYEALNENVIIQLVPKKEATKSGLIVNENPKENSFKGKILSVSEGLIHLKEDQVVFFDKRKILMTLEEKVEGDIVAVSSVDLIATETN